MIPFAWVGVIAVLLIAALAALGLWSHRMRLRQHAEWARQWQDLVERHEAAQRRLLALGEHVIALERRLNQTLDRQLLLRADPGRSGQHASSEQAKQLCSISAAHSGAQDRDRDAEAELRALLASQRSQS